MVLTIQAQVNHRHITGYRVAYIHFTRQFMTYLQDERPWFAYPVKVVTLDP